MKITIATLANKRPDFIELQYRSILQYVKDEQIEYVVFNNAFDDRCRFNAIEDICHTLGVRSVAVGGKDFGNVCETVARLLYAGISTLTVGDGDSFMIRYPYTTFFFRISESILHGPAPVTTSIESAPKRVTCE